VNGSIGQTPQKSYKVSSSQGLKLIREHSIPILIKESVKRRLLESGGSGSISKGLSSSSGTNQWSSLQVSYVDMHKSGGSIHKEAFGLGWRTHFNFCVAKLPATEKTLKQSKFTIFEFVKKVSDGDQVVDTESPQACLLT
jgi:hypothetical protein